MPIVVGVRFKDSGKVYFFDPRDLPALPQGQHVIVETVRGPELAKVAYPPRHANDDEIVGELKPVLRLAEQADLDRLVSLNTRQQELLSRCTEKVIEHNLPMRLVKAEYSFDGSRLTFYFTAEKRVDFRMLVRDLARLFRARIELRQIGPRDEAKLLGGIGPCGRILCCATFLPDYARVSIKMAKDQDLPLNPTKISGVCGRLLCCLAYEHEQYLEIKAELPKKGAWVQTPEGPGEVIAVNVVRETVMVELAGSMMHEEYAPSQLSAATERVATIARSRTDEGITPAALADFERDQTQRRERRTAPEPRREKDRGERRLLRDSIDNPDILDALAMLEDGFVDSNLSDLIEESPPPEWPAPATERPHQEPAQPRIPPRRPVQSQRRSPQGGPTQSEPQRQEPRQPTQPPPAQPTQPEAGEQRTPGMPRRRRRR